MQKHQPTRRNFLLKVGAASGLVALSTPVWISTLWAAPKGVLMGASLAGDGEALTISLVLNQAVKYSVFSLDKPDRVVVDLANTSVQGNLKQGRYDRPPLTSIRYATRSNGSLRVVLDLTSAVNIDSKLAKQGGEQVLNLTLTPKTGRVSGNQTHKTKPEPKAIIVAAPVVEEPIKPVPTTRAPSPSGRKFVVVIDPGHGGHDPGAVGRRGTKEKEVVLSVARKLKSRVDAIPNMQAILTRNSDKFVPLRQRLDLARQYNADLFISIHADANASSQVHGSSVYILSENGASSEAARLLAETENKAFELRLGDVRLAGSHNKIAPILLDLSQNATLDRSLELAKRTLTELANVNNPLRRRVESAGFMVLKAPDIPSVLVETAFLSNPAEEKRLRTDQYQQQLADAIFRGVRSYHQAYADSDGQNYASLDNQVTF